MSNIKNVLGDMDFEEFEVKRKELLKVINDPEIENFNEVLLGDDEKLYDYWLEIGGKDLAQRWINDHGGQLIMTQLDEFRVYLIYKFIDWLESFE